ncbi:MAG: TetR/AcrR family transcriptional regulator [Chloroflexi bacterium]|nr:TetR/AcrR family transcriptional regulator [Chloroflexota bacterium]
METRANRVGRQRIVETAEELFTEHGFRAVSIRDIARSCQISSAALYYHFPSKEALFDEVMTRHAMILGEQMRRAADEKETRRERAAAILREYARVAAERRSPMFMLRREKHGWEKGAAGEHVGKLMQAMLQPLDAVIQEGIEAGELRPLPQGLSGGALLVGMLHGLVQHRRWCAVNETHSGGIEEIVDIFWKGLAR